MTSTSKAQKTIKYKKIDEKGRPMPPQLPIYFTPNEKPIREIQKENNKTYNENDLKNFGL